MSRPALLYHLTLAHQQQSAPALDGNTKVLESVARNRARLILFFGFIDLLIARLSEESPCEAVRRAPVRSRSQKGCGDEFGERTFFAS